MINAIEYVYYAYALVGALCGGSLVLGLYLTRKKDDTSDITHIPHKTYTVTIGSSTLGEKNQ